MKKGLFTFLASLLLFSAWAQVTPRNILAQKYTLDQVKKSLISHQNYHPYPTTPAEWQAAVPDSLLRKVIATAESHLDYEFPPVSATVSLDFVRSGDRERHRGVAYPKRDVLFVLVVAESIEDKGRFTEAIFNGVWSICEESFWGVPAHISRTGLPDVQRPVVELVSAETAALLGLVDYFVGDKLDKINPLIRKRIYYETNHRIFEPMLHTADEYSWMSKTRPVNNWNPWIISNWISLTLTLEKDEARRAEMIHQAMLGLDLYLNGLGEDGGCDEGPSYWFAAGGSVYDCLELVGAATNQQVQIFDHPLIRKMGAYIYKVHIDSDYFVNFADADPTRVPQGLFLYRFGKALNDEKMIEMGKWAFGAFPGEELNMAGHQRPRKIESMMSVKQIGETLPAYGKVRDAWFEDIEVMTARDNSGLFLATHGGHNAESHNHNDVGDFLLYSNGEPVIIDAGRGNYTARTFSPQRYELWFTQSNYHNLPIINGLGQSPGREFGASKAESTINDQSARLSMNIAAAYPAEAGLVNWERTVALNRGKHRVEISDNYTMKTKPQSLQQAFITIADVDWGTAGEIRITTPKNQKFSLRYDPKKWSVASDFPSNEGMEYSSFQTKWDGRRVQRILLTNKDLKAKDKFEYTIERQ
ncbi:heparinase II/III domain-containing protein [Persicitalea jodogahamensis]|uniref:Heparinase n=1 Tax=Persicitalea jodogahamensis TaxID=402147 RepID=A0A8J3D435_9BACT|nr:heparinase II/III family protein [Persicitalea jodogahamensis]GHB79998.1 heparinase [Persicitalea jodogahamensis]